jgi:DNA modification methylase
MVIPKFEFKKLEEVFLNTKPHRSIYINDIYYVYTHEFMHEFLTLLG